MGAINEKEYLMLGKYSQAVLMRGEDDSAPVVLFVHGGPGSAMIGMAEKTTTPWEKDFVVVHWDQLGAGLSYSKNIASADITVDGLLQSMDELVDWLLNRFNKDKLFIAGHSWGSMLSLLYCSKHPEKVAKYVSVSQVIDFKENEQACYELCLRLAAEQQNKKALEELSAIGHPPYADWEKGLYVRSGWADKFKTTVLKGNLTVFFLKSMLFGKTYSLGDIKKWIDGNTFSVHNLVPDINRQNLRETVPSLAIPVLFCLGRYDGNTPSELTVSYCEGLSAPDKQILWFEESAHMCFLEEPEKFYAETARFMLK